MHCFDNMAPFYFFPFLIVWKSLFNNVTPDRHCTLSQAWQGGVEVESIPVIAMC